jgi:hypothetical protein
MIWGFTVNNNITIKKSGPQRPLFIYHNNDYDFTFNSCGFTFTTALVPKYVWKLQR